MVPVLPGLPVTRALLALRAPLGLLVLTPLSRALRALLGLLAPLDLPVLPGLRVPLDLPVLPGRYRTSSSRPRMRRLP